MTGDLHQILVIHNENIQEKDINKSNLLPLNCKKVDLFIQDQINNFITNNIVYYKALSKIDSKYHDKLTLKKYELHPQQFLEYVNSDLPKVGIECFGTIIIDQEIFAKYSGLNKKLMLTKIEREKIESSKIYASRRGFINGIIICPCIITDNCKKGKNCNFYKCKENFVYMKSLDLYQLFYVSDYFIEIDIENIKNSFWLDSLTYALAELAQIAKSF